MAWHSLCNNQRAGERVEGASLRPQAGLLNRIEGQGSLGTPVSLPTQDSPDGKFPLVGPARIYRLCTAHRLTACMRGNLSETCSLLHWPSFGSWPQTASSPKAPQPPQSPDRLLQASMKGGNGPPGSQPSPELGKPLTREHGFFSPLLGLC